MSTMIKYPLALAIFKGTRKLGTIYVAKKVVRNGQAQIEAAVVMTQSTIHHDRGNGDHLPHWHRRWHYLS